MKDFVSKITFGFLMAQLVPGMIAVIAVSLLFLNEEPGAIDLISTMTVCMEFWTDSTQQSILFVFLSTGAGMAIHGLNWTIIGFLECYAFRTATNERKQELEIENDEDQLLSLRDNTWHVRPIYQQLLLGPFRLIQETFLFTVKARNLNEVLMDENVGQINKDKMAGFDFLQEFYLNFAQFYAHTSYALTLLLGSSVFCLITGAAPKADSWIIIFIYLLASYFFLIGRIQMSSLFKGEVKLKGS